MHSFALLFLVFFGLSLAIRFWLSQRHIAHIQQHRGAVPAAFNEKISLDEHQKAADYTSTKVRFGRWPMLYDAALLLIWTFGGGLEWLDQSWRVMALDPIYTGIGVLLSLTLVSSLLDLPFSLYSTFV
ncbi:MAG: M48 family peptidase, partial [Gammaproteobacteria bacterium]|nr:M48 family peptidase [Gammaproteobacteria bacterium]